MNINQNTNFGTHNTAVRPGKIEYIVIHYVGATGDAKANVNYYNQQTTTSASADFFVGFAGDVWQYNPDPVARYCWAVGGAKLSTGGGSLYGIAKNVNCVSIEICVRNNGSKADTSKDWYFEDATVASAIELTKYLMKLYDIPVDHVIRHYDVTGKICPNPFIYNHTKHTWDVFRTALAAHSGYTLGWNHDSNGWWYAVTKSTYYKSCWQVINGHKYYFNSDGYAVTGWQVIDGQDFYFEPRAGHELECSLYLSDANGAQHIGMF